MRKLLGPAVAMVLAVGCGGETLEVASTDPGPTGSRPPLSSTAPPSPSTAPTPPGPTPEPLVSSTAATVTRDGPVVDLFYAIHVHASAEWSPFTSPEMTDLDEADAAGFVDHVEAIAGVLDAHGAVGSFHFTFGTAAGLCRHDPGLFDDLERRGHEIGIHAHSDGYLRQAALAMTMECGRPIGTGSGLAAMAGGPDGTTAASLAASFGVFAEVGARQLMVNMSDWCDSTTAGGNDPTPQRAPLDDVCAESPGGILLIDQAPLEYVLTDGAPADVFSEPEFSIWADLAEAGIAEAAARSADEVVVWGFVTHTNEYVIGTGPRAAPRAEALAGLDLLLTRLDPYVADGRARWSTAAQIASRVP